MEQPFSNGVISCMYYIVLYAVTWHCTGTANIVFEGKRWIPIPLYRTLDKYIAAGCYYIPVSAINTVN